MLCGKDFRGHVNNNIPRIHSWPPHVLISLTSHMIIYTVLLLLLFQADGRVNNVIFFNDIVKYIRTGIFQDSFSES